MNFRLACFWLTGTVAISALTAPASAAPFMPFDVRASGMGGTGIAAAKAASAALFNPAMLSAQAEGDKFQLVLGAGVQMADESQMFDQTDVLIARFDSLNAALGASNTVQAQLDAAQAALELGAIDGDYLLLGGGGTLGIGIPGANVGVGLAISGNAYADATPRINSTDINALLDLADNGVLDTYGSKVVGNTFQTDSTADSTGIIVTEIGVALSHRIDIASGGILAVGITPKAVDVTSYRYEQNLDSYDSANIDNAQFKKVDNHVDLDAGVVYRPQAGSQWQYGVVVRNLANQSYTSVAGTPTRGIASAARTIDIGMQLRAGVARMTEHNTLTADLDLTKNEGIAPGSETQFLALGAEYDLKFVQARCGYRANLANSKVDDAFSAGIGLGPVDIAVIGNANDVGAYLQLGFGW